MCRQHKHANTNVGSLACYNVYKTYYIFVHNYGSLSCFCASETLCVSGSLPVLEASVLSTLGSCRTTFIIRLYTLLENGVCFERNVCVIMVFSSLAYIHRCLVVGTYAPVNMDVFVVTL